MQGEGEGMEKHKGKNFASPSKQGRISIKEMLVMNQHMVRRSRYRTAESAAGVQVTSAAWSWHESFWTQHTPLNIIYFLCWELWLIFITDMLVYFKVPSQNLQLICHKPRTPLCWTFMKNHKAGLGTGSAAPQPAVSTPCTLCSAAGPVLLSISQCPQPPTQHPTHGLENIYHNNAAGALLSCNEPQGEVSHCLKRTSKLQQQRKTTAV